MTSISAGTCMRFDSISMFALRLNIYLQIDCISHHMKIISYLPRQNLLNKVGFNSTIRHATVKTSVRVKCSSSIPVDHSIIKVSSQISVNHSFCTNERKHKWSLLRLQACVITVVCWKLFFGILWTFFNCSDAMKLISRWLNSANELWQKNMKWANYFNCMSKSSTCRPFLKLLRSKHSLILMRV